MGSSLLAVNRDLSSRQTLVKPSPEQTLAIKTAASRFRQEERISPQSDDFWQQVPERLLPQPLPTLAKPTISAREISGYQSSDVVLKLKQIIMKVAYNSFTEVWSEMNPAQRLDTINGIIGLLHEEHNQSNQNGIYQYLELGVLPAGDLGQKLKEELEQKIVPSLFQQYILTLRNSSQQQEPAPKNQALKPLNRYLEKIVTLIKGIEGKISAFVHGQKW